MIRPITAVSSANFRMMLSLWEATQSRVKRVLRIGLRTHRCGVPTFVMIKAEVLLQILGAMVVVLKQEGTVLCTGRRG